MTEAPPFRIREARAEDVAALAELHVATQCRFRRGSFDVKVEQPRKWQLIRGRRCRVRRNY